MSDLTRFYRVFGQAKPRLSPVAITASQREEVVRRDGPVCRYCGRILADSEITMDHVVPRKLDGTNDPANLVVSCRPCNSSKGSRSEPSTWVVNR